MTPFYLSSQALQGFYALVKNCKTTLPIPLVQSLFVNVKIPASQNHYKEKLGIFVAVNG
jgi:hypothetical protein